MDRIEYYFNPGEGSGKTANKADDDFDDDPDETKNPAHLMRDDSGQLMVDEADVGGLFAHGHYHIADTKQVDNTLLLSLNCDNNQLANGVLDLASLEFEWLPILRVLPEDSSSR